MSSAGKAVVGSTVRKVLVGPYLTHYLHHLPEKLPVLRILARVGVGMKLWTLVRPDSPAEPNLHASAGHVVQHRKVFSKPYRVPPGSYVRHLADANPGRPRREVCAKQDRVRQIAHSIGPKVVFSEPHGLEAELLGQNGLLSEVVNHLLGVGGLAGGRRHCRERPEFHVCNPLLCLALQYVPGMVIDKDPIDTMNHIFGRGHAPRCAPERYCYACRPSCYKEWAPCHQAGFGV